MTYANELSRIEPSFSKFILGHEGLSLPQPCSNFRLRKPSVFSGCDKQIDHMAVKIRANRRQGKRQFEDQHFNKTRF